MMKVAKKVEEQKKFPKEQQVPRLWPSQLSHSSDTPYLYGAFCTHQHASPFPIAKQIEREQENRRKVARGRKKKKKKSTFLPLAILIVISIKSYQKEC